MAVSFRALGILVLAGTALTACTGYRESRGYILDQELAAAIQPGVDNKESVQRTLGRPTFTAQFDPNEWYYLSRQTNALAFRKPRVTDQTVLRVRFDQAGNVAAVDRTGEELVAAINPYGKETPTLGRRKSFFEEFFGNIGVVGSGNPAGATRPDR